MTTLLERLKKLRHHRSKPSLGICANARAFKKGDAHSLDTLMRLSTTWPRFSGNLCYPVPATKQFNSKIAPDEEIQFTTCSDEEMWTEGPYAALRLDLLEHLITELEREQTTAQTLP